jgi:MtN3 and saliva related transmembrane protein
MPAPIAETIGALAATFTTLSFLPQVVKTWRTQAAADLSWIWLGAFSTGLFLWLVYGLVIGAIPIIGANGITLALVLTIAFVKWRAES